MNVVKVIESSIQVYIVLAPYSCVIAIYWLVYPYLPVIHLCIVESLISLCKKDIVEVYGLLHTTMPYTRLLVAYVQLK